MCTVSMIMDKDKLWPLNPPSSPNTWTYPDYDALNKLSELLSESTRELNLLKDKNRNLEEEIILLKERLEKANKVDNETGQSECHDPLKTKLLVNMILESKKLGNKNLELQIEMLAKLLGLDVSE